MQDTRRWGGTLQPVISPSPPCRARMKMERAKSHERRKGRSIYDKSDCLVSCGRKTWFNNNNDIPASLVSHQLTNLFKFRYRVLLDSQCHQVHHIHPFRVEPRKTEREAKWFIRGRTESLDYLKVSRELEVSKKAERTGWESRLRGSRWSPSEGVRRKKAVPNTTTNTGVERLERVNPKWGSRYPVDC